jgi:hypothetical protein
VLILIALAHQSIRVPRAPAHEPELSEPAVTGSAA